MTETIKNTKHYTVTAEHIEKLNHVDLQDLCDATEAAIDKDGGFGWVTIPERDVLERFWHGVVTAPHRDLFVARLDGAIAGTAQLVRVPANNQAQSFGGQITSFFIAPWARDKGLSDLLLATLEKRAKDIGLSVLNLDVRETQQNAIKLFKRSGYTQWGMNPLYALVNDRVVPGYFFHKTIQPLPSIIPIET